MGSPPGYFSQLHCTSCEHRRREMQFHNVRIFCGIARVSRSVGAGRCFCFHCANCPQTVSCMSSTSRLFTCSRFTSLAVPSSFRATCPLPLLRCALAISLQQTKHQQTTKLTSDAHHQSTCYNCQPIRPATLAAQMPSSSGKPHIQCEQVRHSPQQVKLFCTSRSPWQLQLPMQLYFAWPVGENSAKVVALSSYAKSEKGVGGIHYTGGWA